MRVPVRCSFAIGTLVLFSMSHAQSWPDHRWDTWYFGDGAGLQFPGGDAVGILGNPYANYGTGNAISVSDPVSGELLFYGGKQGFWDRAGNVLVDQATLNACDKRSILAVQLPGQDSVHAIIYRHQDPLTLVWGLYQGRIDLRLNNGPAPR